MFLSFDSILSEPSRTQATAYERYGSLGSATHKHTSEYSNRGVNGGKKRWALLRSMLPFASTSGDNQSKFSTASNAPASTEIPQKPSKLNLEQEKQTAGDRRTQAALEAESGIAGARSLVWDNPYSSHSFKFSLEWIEQGNNYAELERSLLPPKLPFTARTSSKHIHFIQPEYSPCKPTGAAARSSKYAGRALSEWEMVANECQNFFDRRKSEGVPTNHKVETPTLGVESFRKM